MKRYFYLSLVLFAFLFPGCMSDGSLTIALPEASGDSLQNPGDSLQNSDMRFIPAEIPPGTADIIKGAQFIAIDSSSGSGTLIFTSSGKLDELYLQIDGEDGYYIKQLSSNDIANTTGGRYTYSVDLDFEQGLIADEQNIMVGGKSIRGILSNVKVSENSIIERYSCGKEISGDYAGFIGSFDMGQDSGSFTFEYETYSAPDDITIYGNSQARGEPIFRYPSGSTGGWETETVYFNERIISVKVIGLSSGTLWAFRLHCLD